MEEKIGLKKYPFYGWIIVATSTLILAAGIGIFSGTNSVFVKPVCESLGLARGEFTLYRTIIFLLGAITMPLYARLIRRVGVKKLLLTCAIGIGCAVACYSLATKLWHFYAFALVEGLFTNGISFVTIGTIVNAWFEDKRGLATGLAYAGSGFGGALFTPLVASLIEQIGWRWAYRAMAATGILILLPLILFLIKNQPKEKGLSPYFDKKKRQVQTGEIVVEKTGLMLKDALKTKKFWFLIVGFFCISVCCGGPYIHTVAYLTDLSYTAAFAASVMSAYMIFLTIGKVLLGVIFDKIGVPLSTVLLCICCIGFPIFALLAVMPAAPWVYAVFLGFSGSGCSVAISILVTHMFGNRDFSSIFSIFLMATTFGTALAIPFMGIIYDVSGSYTIAWVAILVLACITAFCLISATIAHHKQISR